MLRRTIFRHLYFQVLAAILLGALVGYFYPKFGLQLKPLGDGFIKLIRMVVAPIIFTTVVLGIAGMSSLKRAGRSEPACRLWIGTDFECVNEDHWHDRPSGAYRCLRRDRFYHRAVRARKSRIARKTHGLCLHHLPLVHLCAARIAHAVDRSRA